MGILWDTIRESFKVPTWMSILVIVPPFQRKGYGSLLYELAHYEALRKCSLGGPERPLTPIGTALFHYFCDGTILQCLMRNPESKYGDLSVLTAFDFPIIEATVKRLQIIGEVRRNLVPTLDRTKIEKAWDSRKESW
eukprot:CAMPEP_0168536652 /NCGR_PEP_ID=MMETSP0405-20121227/19722_1 /TAXON_ID=498012 /ORGANISM="Trichosphaerium sp, Strain Am-I-7 wt" /LENGTH=136 /DNA_ID=CAMNT_0008564789 /DNA_START=39 /DNA_END=446 /DNA_ORIENTATION=-